MPAVIVRRRSRPMWTIVLVVVLGILVVGIAALAIHLATGGSVTIPFTEPAKVVSFRAKEEPKVWTPPPGSVAVPIAARNIPAYTMVTRDDFWNPTTQKLTFVHLDKGQVSETMLTDLKQILGRVLSHDKSAGYVFTNADFLPEGTRPGLVAGIPAGMRAMRIELGKVRGLYGLHPGDRFDVLATIPVATDPAKDLRKVGGAFGERAALEASMSNAAKQATVRVVVQNGVVVSPVQTIEIPMSTASLTQGVAVRAKPIQEVVVAVHPEEVTALAEALAVGADVSVVPRSGRPDEPKDSVTPNRLPRLPFSGEGGEGGSASGISFVETIDGTRRDVVPVPKPEPGKEEEKK